MRRPSWLSCRPRSAVQRLSWLSWNSDTTRWTAARQRLLSFVTTRRLSWRICGLRAGSSGASSMRLCQRMPSFLATSRRCDACFSSCSSSSWAASWWRTWCFLTLCEELVLVASACTSTSPPLLLGTRSRRTLPSGSVQQRTRCCGKTYTLF